jgi:hypothetical protein
MSTIAVEQAYPNISFRRKSRNLWARLMRMPAECAHLESEQSWMAAFVPDTLYLQGKAAPRRTPVRPEASLCRECLRELLEPELASYSGHVVAFEPDSDAFTQYFFVERDDFDDAGLRPEVGAAMESRLKNISGPCCECGEAATWLWISRREVASLDQTERIEDSPGALYCARHGAAKLCDVLTSIDEANLFYLNTPYGNSGVYVWI